MVGGEVVGAGFVLGGGGGVVTGCSPVVGSGSMVFAEEPEDGEPDEWITGDVDPVVSGTAVLGVPDGGDVEVLAGASLVGGAVPEPVWVRVVAPPLQAANTTAAEISSARGPDEARRLRLRLKLP